MGACTLECYVSQLNNQCLNKLWWSLCELPILQALSANIKPDQERAISDKRMILHPKSKCTLFRCFIISYGQFLHLSSVLFNYDGKIESLLKSTLSGILDLKRTIGIIQSNLPKKSKEDEWCSIGTLESSYKAEVFLRHFHLRPLSTRVSLQGLCLSEVFNLKNDPVSGILRIGLWYVARTPD